MFPEYSAVKLTESTLDAWFALVPSQDKKGAVERLRLELRDRPDRTRIVFSDASEPAAACIIERAPPGATTWTPRVRAGLSKEVRDHLLRKVATHIVKMGVAEGLRYLECTLRHTIDAELAWRDAMLATGFKVVSRKCHYECALPSGARPRAGERPEVITLDSEDARVERVFARTLQESRDPTTVFEGRHGAGLGSSELVLVAYHEGLEAGLCALEHEQGAKRGWIKYVGTVPEARRTGVAQELVAKGLACLAIRGASVAECLIDVENEASVALFDRFGFRATGACGDSYYASL